MPEKTKEIEKPWCVYGNFLGLRGFGKIVGESGNAVSILYSETQQYYPQSRDSKWIERFNTLEESVKHYIQHRPQVDIHDKDFTDNEIKELAKRKFPSYFNKDK